MLIYRRNTYYSFLFGLLLLVFSETTLGASIDVAGRRLIVTQPPGYCWLDMNGRESQMAQQADELATRTGQELLLLFADCKELSDLRANRRTYLSTLGQISALRGKGGTVVPTKQSRREVIEQVQRQMHSSPKVDVRREANRSIPGTLLSMGTPTLLAVDEYGAYYGSMVRSRTSQGKDRTMAAIVAFSALNNIQILVRLGDDALKEPYDFAPLLARLRILMRELVQLN